MANSTLTSSSLPATIATTLNATISATLTALTTNITTRTSASATNTTIFSTTSNSNTTVDFCLQKYSVGTCRLGSFIRVLAYLLLAVSLIPQILHLVKNGSRYIAGISYMWLVIRVLGLAALIIAHAYKWPAFFELVALVSTLVIFVQIFISANSLHRQQKIVLVVASLATWLIGIGLLLILRKYETFLIMTGYILLSVHMVPQILLNSLLRTTKALSKFSILFLALSDTLLFASFYTVNEHYAYLVTAYYAFSFFLFMYLQSLVYADSHIHVIARSSHTVLSSGVDILTATETASARNAGDEPQMFSIDDLEPGDSTDVVYQPVTSNRPGQALHDQPPMNRFVWYATLSSVVGIEIVLTVMIILRAWSPWIVLLPISIPAILAIFYLLRTQLSDIQTEFLRMVL